MRSSEYFRAQARLYRDIAQLLSDRAAHDSAMAVAADYLDTAKQLEDKEREAFERGGPAINVSQDQTP